MTDLADFLLARIAEDERAAHAARGLLGIDTPWYQAANLRERGLTRADAQFVEHNTPARALAECEAKRRIVEREAPGPRSAPDSALQWTYTPPVLALLALPYADHPDYREEWRP